MTATATPTTGAKKGHPGIQTPYNTSEFHEMTNTARAHFMALHDQLVTIAAELKRELARIQGAPALFGLDTRLAARKVTRHLAHAAGYQEAAAKAATRAYTEYQQTFLGRAPSHGKGFDINK